MIIPWFFNRRGKFFFDKLLKKMMLPRDAKAVAVQLVTDKFIESSTKSGARMIRGEATP